MKQDMSELVQISLREHGIEANEDVVNVVIETINQRVESLRARGDIEDSQHQVMLTTIKQFAKLADDFKKAFLELCEGLPDSDDKNRNTTKFNGTYLLDVAKVQRDNPNRSTRKLYDVLIKSESLALQHEPKSLTLKQALDEYEQYYRSELKKNGDASVGGKYKEDVIDKVRNTEDRKLVTTNRLMDKKFAFYFMSGLKGLGYDSCIPYGRLYDENMDKPLEGQSRLAAVLLFAKDSAIPPMLIELGNSGGYMQVNGVKISARDRGQGVNAFTIITNPATASIVMTSDASRAESTRCLLPSTLRDVVFAKGNFDVNTMKADVVRLVESALTQAQKEMPSNLQARAEGYVSSYSLADFVAPVKPSNPFGWTHSKNQSDTPSYSEEQISPKRSSKG